MFKISTFGLLSASIVVLAKEIAPNTSPAVNYAASAIEPFYQREVEHHGPYLHDEDYQGLNWENSNQIAPKFSQVTERQVSSLKLFNKFLVLQMSEVRLSKIP